MTTFLDPKSRVERMLAANERVIAEAYVLLVRRLRGQATEEQLAEAIVLGTERNALNQLESTAQLLGSAWSETFVDSGRRTGVFVSAALSGHNVVQKVHISVIFDQTNLRAQDQMRANSLRLVRGFSQGQRAATQQALVEAVGAGVNPRVAARAFRNSIGLTARQTRAVANFRRLLREQSLEALTRQLRDRRFDGTVRRAFRAGEPLSGRQIDRMVQRYYERSVKHRAEVIARTEALRSTHAGTKELYDQAIEQGALRADDLVRTWETAKDERVRDFSGGAQTSHASMQGQQTDPQGFFTSGAGNQTQNPGQFGIGFEDVQCRCVVTTRFTDSAVAGAPGAFTFEIIGG